MRKMIIVLFACGLLSVLNTNVGATGASWRALSAQLVSMSTPLIVAHRYVEAIDLLEQALVADPKNARAFVLRGEVAFAQHDDAFGIEALQTGLALMPDDASAHLGLGRAYLRVNDMAAASRQLEQLRAVCDNCAEVQTLSDEIARRERLAGETPSSP